MQICVSKLVGYILLKLGLYFRMQQVGRFGRDRKGTGMTFAAAVPEKNARTEWLTMSIISIVHLVSHFYWLALVPLLPALKQLLQVSWVQLGFAITLMNVVSALTQAPTGFLVDRFGARLFLVLGVLAGAAGFVLIGLVPVYPVLLIAAVLIGLGNAVYHPADFSILSAEMSNERMGRAYSVHGFAGYAGFALAPPIVLGLAYFGGTQFALVATGLIGVLLSLPLVPGYIRERRTARPQVSVEARTKNSARALLTPAVIALTIMFTVLSLSTAIMQTFMVVALAGMSDLSHAVGNSALTIFLFAVMTGVLCGGFITDRVSYQSTIAAAGFGIAALIVVALAIVKPDAPTTLIMIGATGFLVGIIMPSRDLLVRNAAPPDAVGRIFGIVTTGFNFGGMIGPLVGGVLIDYGLFSQVFYLSAVFMAFTVVIAVAVDRKAGPG